MGAAIERFVDELANAFGVCLSVPLCHHDMCENNVPMEGTRNGLVLSGLLDVEQCRRGRPLIDLFEDVALFDSIRRSQMARSRGGPGDLVDRAHEHLDLWRLYHSLELWDWFAQTGNRSGVESVSPDLVLFSSTASDL